MAKSKSNTKAKKTNIKVNIFQQEQSKAIDEILKFKLIAETNVVSMIFKEPDTIFNYDLKLDDFHENCWKVYFTILESIIVKEKKIPDNITIGLYLEKHPKLKQKYEEYGGFKTLNDSKAYVKVENLDAYVSELMKWKSVIGLVKRGFPVYHRVSDFVDMSAEEIYSEYETLLTHTFINNDGDVKTYNLSDGIDELIDELDDGFAIGLPFDSLPMLTRETGGKMLGSITLVGGLSNVGKSTFARNTIIPSIIAHDEKVVFMVNEDDLSKFQREMLVWVANNILKEDLQKYTVRRGKYTKETKDILRQAANWIKEKSENNSVTVVPFEKYTTAQAIKVIKKYTSLGDVKYFCLDTFKMDAGEISDKSWLQLQQNMTDISDVVKKSAKNVHILITFQLNKASSKQRCYTQDNIGGGGKNIIDVASTCIMIRNVLDDEFPDCKKEVKVWKLVGSSKVPVRLDPSKRYQILFLIKNREGGTNFQVVVENDLSRNTMKEVGICAIEPDY